MKIVAAVCFALLLSVQLHAKPIESKIGHLYWGVGPNLGLLGNIRLGFSSIELGLLQGTGYGVVWVHRTATPLFFEIGGLVSSGAGIIGGGGMEWDTFSFIRLRTDITVSTDSHYQTQGFVSIGGVFIL